MIKELNKMMYILRFFPSLLFHFKLLCLTTFSLAFARLLSSSILPLRVKFMLRKTYIQLIFYEILWWLKDGYMILDCCTVPCAWIVEEGCRKVVKGRKVHILNCWSELRVNSFFFQFTRSWMINKLFVSRLMQPCLNLIRKNLVHSRIFQ